MPYEVLVDGLKKIDSPATDYGIGACGHQKKLAKSWQISFALDDYSTFVTSSNSVSTMGAHLPRKL